MYPQTHVYFARRILGRMNDAAAIGSIFPDIAVGVVFNRNSSHGSGSQILEFLHLDNELLDFAMANITHGTNPAGIDYYGDEKNRLYEYGYCFEKGREFVDSTIKACNLPPEMGWWKSHNIIEMGIELRISACENYRQCLASAFNNEVLINNICDHMSLFFKIDRPALYKRISNFPSYIDLTPSTAESLAAKYDIQMGHKHSISINVPEVAKLIKSASLAVASDVDDFFDLATEKVKDLPYFKLKHI